jgi:hypothetical protein
MSFDVDVTYQVSKDFPKEFYTFSQPGLVSRPPAFTEEQYGANKFFVCNYLF